MYMKQLIDFQIEFDFNDLYPNKELILYSSFNLFKIQLHYYIKIYELDLKNKNSMLMNEIENPSKPFYM